MRRRIDKTALSLAIELITKQWTTKTQNRNPNNDGDKFTVNGLIERKIQMVYTFVGENLIMDIQYEKLGSLNRQASL